MMGKDNTEEFVNVGQDIFCIDCYMKKSEIYYKGFQDGRRTHESKMGDILSKQIDRYDAWWDELPANIYKLMMWIKLKIFRDKHRGIRR